MPTVGNVEFESGYIHEKIKNIKRYESSFKKESEFASPGFYSVILKDNNIRVELTTSLRSGKHKCSFLKRDQSNIIIDLTHRDDILEGGLAPNALVMSWRGTKGGIKAAKSEHYVVMSPGSHCYFDHYQSEDTENEPLAIGGYRCKEGIFL